MKSLFLLGLVVLLSFNIHYVNSTACAVAGKCCETTADCADAVQIFSPAGKFGYAAATAACPVCGTCAAGTVSVVSTAGAAVTSCTACTLAATNFAPVNHEGACLAACANGQFYPSTVATDRQCLLCTAASNCLTCGGTTAAAGATTCLTCLAANTGTKYYLEGSTCIAACPSGKWGKLSAATATAATTGTCTTNTVGCATSEASTDATTEKCLTCSTGYGPLASEKCPKIVCTDTTGCDVCSDAATCTTCKTGYTLASGKCTKTSTSGSLLTTSVIALATGIIGVANL